MLCSKRKAATGSSSFARASDVCTNRAKRSCGPADADYLHRWLTRWTPCGRSFGDFVSAFAPSRVMRSTRRGELWFLLLILTTIGVIVSSNELVGPDTIQPCRPPPTSPPAHRHYNHLHTQQLRSISGVLLSRASTTRCVHRAQVSSQSAWWKLWGVHDGERAGRRLLHRSPPVWHRHTPPKHTNTRAL
jgi:hypothetical protein